MPLGDEQPTCSKIPAAHADASVGLPTALGRLLEYQEQEGEWIGPYQLVRVIGEGGFGVVWLAERREPMVQRVALKLIKPGMDSKEIIARFEQERQALAVMDHPNVARVYDGGVAPASMGARPYFVMEHVQGEPITDYADRHTLTNRERLELFIPVCEAVQHAHMKGVIHRDIKPSNILVTIKDDRAIPKVIDFGVAKAIRHTLTEKSIFTEQGRMIGTPEYMSPEQAEMGGLDIDTRTDVYALGVVLYELLTGLLPFDSIELRSKGFAEIQRIIREVDPPTPSKRLTTMADASGAEIARRRQGQREAITRELRRELEWVPLKAMRKDRTQRYSSAEGLAADVRRFLDGRALEAGPESTGYRVRKFVRRNRGAVVAVGAVGLALVLGFGVALVQRNEAVRQASRADKWAAAESARRIEVEQAQKRLEAIIAFFSEIIQFSDPSVGGNQQLTVADMVTRAVKSIEAGAFKDDPRIAAGLEDTFGSVLQNNGKSVEAEALLREGLRKREGLFTGDHQEIADSVRNLAASVLDQGRLEEAEGLFKRALEMNERLHPGDHEETARSLDFLAMTRFARGFPAESEPMLLRALEMRRRLPTGETVDMARGMDFLAQLRYASAGPKEAEGMFAEALGVRRRVLRGDHPDVAASIGNLAQMIASQGRPAEAEARCREALEMYRRIFKGDHPATAAMMCNLGAIVQDLRRTEEAEGLYRESLAMKQRITPGDHPAVATGMGNLAGLLMKSGREAEAEELFVGALGMRRRLFTGDNADIAQGLDNLARCRVRRGKFNEAEQVAREAMGMYERVPELDHPRLAMTMSVVATIMFRQGKIEEARTLIARAVEIVGKSQTPEGVDARYVLGAKKMIFQE